MSALPSLAAVAVMFAHAVATGSLLSLAYGVFGGSAVATWLALRRSSGTTRGADVLLIPVVLLLLRSVASP
jgi:hypothetical protein